MQKLSKNQFMRKVINDKYSKKLRENDKARSADIHSIENIYKVRKKER